MSQFTTFTATISRLELGLGALNINDHVTYILADQIMGAQQTWNRQTAKSPFVDGEFTVHRSKGNRQESLAVQVLGADQLTLQTNVQALLTAASQFRFSLTIGMDNANPRVYQCETADYVVDWNASRWMAKKVLVTLQIPVYPDGVNGA